MQVIAQPVILVTLFSLICYDLIVYADPPPRPAIAVTPGSRVLGTSGDGLKFLKPWIQMYHCSLKWLLYGSIGPSDTRVANKGV